MLATLSKYPICTLCRFVPSTGQLHTTTHRARQINARGKAKREQKDHEAAYALRLQTIRDKQLEYGSSERSYPPEENGECWDAHQQHVKLGKLSDTLRTSYGTAKGFKKGWEEQLEGMDISKSETDYATKAYDPSKDPTPPRYSLKSGNTATRYQRNQSKPAAEEEGTAMFTLEQTSLYLRGQLNDWSRSTTVHSLLSNLAEDGSLHALLPRFTVSADSELQELENDASKDNEEYWNLAKVRDIIARNSLREGADKAFFWRFMTWAPTQALSDMEADPTRGPLGYLIRLRNALTTWRPPDSYPLARALRRKIILHVGPTNSGKTYHALQALVKARSGLYAGPLRLLAHEIWERINTGTIDGTPRPCNLATGEELRLVSDEAKFISCTVEMTAIKTRFEVAVIDEIQMIGDAERGNAWTTALLGLQADELHLCGEDTVIPLVTDLARECGDELIINRYKRLTPLTIADTAIDTIQNVRPGDCVVAFSRSRIFALRKQIQNLTGLKCALAYGALPPEVRSEQAKLFNDPDSGYDVMVASDAIGMGLNLKIKRIVFEAMSKWSGRQQLPLSTSQVKQIAGRAGRFGLHGGAGGEVTTLDSADLNELRLAMATPNAPIERAYFDGDVTNYEKVVKALPADKFGGLAMLLWSQYARLGMSYSMVTMTPQRTEMMKLQERLGHVPLVEQYVWSMVPYPGSRAPDASAIFDRYMSIYCEGNSTVDLLGILREQGLLQCLEKVNTYRSAKEEDLPALLERREIRQVLEAPQTLTALETMHKTVSIYLWLSYRFPLSFNDQDIAFKTKQEIEDATQAVLLHGTTLEKGPRRDAEGRSRSRVARQPSHSDKEVEWERQRRPSRPLTQVAFEEGGQVKVTSPSGASFTMEDKSRLPGARR